MRVYKNDDTLMWHLVKYLKFEIAEKMEFEEFVNWFVKKIIIPYAGKENLSEKISLAVGSST